MNIKLMSTKMIRAKKRWPIGVVSSSVRSMEGQQTRCPSVLFAKTIQQKGNAKQTNEEPEEYHQTDQVPSSEILKLKLIL